MKPLKHTPVICILLAVITIWVGGRSIASITASTPSMDMSERPVIVIDAGHGGFDGGAEGLNGTIEKDINLAIASKLYDLFIASGFEAVMTRDADISLEDKGISGIRKRKNSDIHNRLALSDSFENSILLSIHQNKFPQSQPFGAQVFYGPKNPESARMAAILQQNMIDMLQPANTRHEKPCTDSVYLIYNAPMPALLVECGFISNADDVQRLTDTKYQQKIAFAIFAATCEAFGLEVPIQQPM